MTRYEFIGRILPERARFNDFKAEIQLASEFAGSRVNVSVFLNHIFATVTTPNPVSDIYTLRNYVTEVLRAPIDAAGFVQGYAYELEIFAVTSPDLQDPFLFGINIPALKDFFPDPTKKFQQLLQLLSTSHSRYLHRALSDLREAMRNPSDTPFFCNRAIETIKQFYFYEKKASSNKEAWALMAKELDQDPMDPDYIQIRDWALPARHGDHRVLSSDDRKRCFLFSWKVIDKFVNKVSS